MECCFFRVLIQRYYDGELDPVERAEYENHRRLCESCRAMDRQSAHVFRVLGGIPLLEPSADFNRVVLARVDSSRYRVGALRRSFGALGRAWAWVPTSVRAGGAIAAVFALFVTAYRPLLSLLISIGERAITFMGSSFLVLWGIAERAGTAIKYLISSTNYRVAGETILKTFQRMVSGIPLSHIAIAAAAVLVILLVTIKTTHVAFKKGETHVGIF